jgi:hypothetical protein
MQARHDQPSSLPHARRTCSWLSGYDVDSRGEEHNGLVPGSNAVTAEVGTSLHFSGFPTLPGIALGDGSRNASCDLRPCEINGAQYRKKDCESLERER